MLLLLLLLHLRPRTAVDVEWKTRIVFLRMLLLAAMSTTCCFCFCFCFGLFIHGSHASPSPSSGSAASPSDLSDAFYMDSCPQAERIINDTLSVILSRNISQAAGLLRLAFHDCFVQGCDGSVLLDSDWDDGAPEKLAAPNKNSLKGFEIVDEIKQKLEAVCPMTVSCADIIALSARHAVIQTGGPTYEPGKGRRDSTNSSMAKANAELPSPSLNISGIVDIFASKGLNKLDIVSLLGAHTIGVAKCSTFNQRIGASHRIDPQLNMSFWLDLVRQCKPFKDNGEYHVPLDDASVEVFDNSYYKGLLQARGLLTSDEAILNDSATRSLVLQYASSQELFFDGFRKSMAKMSSINVLTGNEGEIRVNCSLQNSRLLIK